MSSQDQDMASGSKDKGDEPLTEDTVPLKWAPVRHSEADRDSENAIANDDDDILDDEMTNLARIQSAKRREFKEKSHQNRIQELVGFPFSPIVHPLGLSDLESVIILENTAFTEPEHRASPNKLEYRLATCPELSMGLFHTVVPSQVKDLSLFPTLDVAHPVETDRPDQAKSVLWAHIVATASNSKFVEDDDMDIPTDWKKGQGSKDTGKGHVEGGRTVCLHSLAVCPKLQGCGLGKVILKSFLWQMKAIGVERVALICQDYLVSYYERFGFKHAGMSVANFGGGGWHDMVFDLGTVAGPAGGAPYPGPAVQSSSSSP